MTQRTMNTDHVAPLNFRLQFALLLLVFLFFVGGVTWVVVSRSQNQLIEFQTSKIAEIVARMSTSARSVYSDLAVSKLKRDGLGASAESDDVHGHVPLPAQFLKQLSRDSVADAEGLYRFKPVSLWNLAPEQGIEDDFQRWAWSQLEAQNRMAPDTAIDWKSVWRVERVDGQQTLRFMQADPAVSASCVNCHNALEQLPETIAIRKAAGIDPGHQWQLHELLGAIEIDIPLDLATALAREQTQKGLAMVIIVTIIGLLAVGLLVYFYAIRNRQLTTELSRQARHDVLTGLPNRLDLDRELKILLGSASDSGEQHAVMILDLDNFKQINDTLGHDVGDEVLKQTSERLRQALRVGDFVARLGGDEFTVVLRNVNRRSAQDMAVRIADSIEKEYRIGDYQLGSGASIGIAMTPDNGYSAPELMRCADVAMYIAKNANVSHSFYEAAQDDNHVSRIELTNDLREALRSGGLSVHFQPKYSLTEGRMVGAEALLRWYHPTHGAISPPEMVTIAERCGLMTDLTQWVLVQSIEQCRRWRLNGFDLHVAVNLSASSLHDADLVKNVLEALDEAGMPADALVLEVTESAVMKDPKRAEQALRDMAQRGVKLSVDDYGTGYCSLSYLNRLPVQELKLDRSFVKNVFKGEKDAVIVDATLDLAHRLGLSMVAEGIEDARSLDYLREIGCDVVQGYFLCRPLSAGELHKRLPYIYRFSPAAGQLSRAA